MGEDFLTEKYTRGITNWWKLMGDVARRAPTKRNVNL